MVVAPDKPDLEKIASDWIAFAKEGPNGPEEVFVRGWVLYDLVDDDPALAWMVMQKIVDRYAEDDFFSDGTEARCAVGNMSAGPLESLLERHGPQFIDVIEIEARRDRRMAWALRGVWRSSMSEEIWQRVQRAAANIPPW